MPSALTRRLNIARSTLEWHFAHLEDQDIIRKGRNERNHVTLVLTRPEEIAVLLQTVQPSTAIRMVDRFIRPTDHLLDDFDEPE